MHIITLFYVFCICIIHMQMDALPSITGRPRTKGTNVQEQPKVTVLNIQEDKPQTEESSAQEKDTTQRDCESILSRIWYALQGYTKVSPEK